MESNMIDKNIGLTKQQFIKRMYDALISNFDKPTKQDKIDMLKEAKFEFELLCSRNLACYEEYNFIDGKIAKEVVVPQKQTRLKKSRCSGDSDNFDKAQSNYRNKDWGDKGW
jgi:hypothetical protein